MTTIALSPLAPHARLIRMSDGVTLATTAMLLGGTQRQSRMNAASGCTVIVPLSDPGPYPSSLNPLGAWNSGTTYHALDQVSYNGLEWRSLTTNTNSIPAGANTDWSVIGFANALLTGGGGPGIGTTAPILLSVSLDGGTSYDFHRLVQKPLRDSDPARLTLTESGEDIFTEYSKIPAGGGRGSLSGCQLVDVLGGKPGEIIPLTAFQGFISADHKVPFECGLLYPVASVFQDVPGNPAWNATALSLLQFVAVVATQGLTDEDALALDLPTSIDDWSDNQQHALTVLVEALGGILLAGDTAVLGSRANWVADCSDHALNVAGTMAGCVCDGTPGTATYPTTSGQYGKSNARSSGREVSRSVIIGSVGAPSGLLFTDTPSSMIIDETAEAQIITSKVTIEPDLTVLHGACSFDGGASDAGFPAGGTITALTQVNRSAGDDAWTTCLPLVGVNVSEKTGGVFLYDTMGRFIPLNNSQSIAVHDLWVDTVDNLIYVATPHGVYERTSDITNTTDPWILTGGLTGSVKRLMGLVVSDTFYLYAHVEDPTNSAINGIYFHSLSAPASGVGYNDWIKMGLTANIVDFQATDQNSFFYIDKSDQAQGKLHLCHWAASPPTTDQFTLPSNVVALRLDRVLATSQDTVFIATTGDDQAGYYLSYNTGTNSWVTNGLLPAKLAVGQNLQVNRWVGPNEDINTGSSQVLVLAAACTNNGLYVSATNTPTATSDWLSANDQNGLAGISITNMSAGEAQYLCSKLTSRVYACTDRALYQSSNSAAQFDDVNQQPLDLAPVFADMVIQTTGNYPTNKIRTAGPMSSSPIGLGSDTHVQVTTYDGYASFPTGGYIERRLNGRVGWEWRVWDGTCPFTAIQKDTLSDVQADETQDALTAAKIVLAISKKWLWQNSTANTILHLPSYFTQTNAVLRKLQPGQLVNVTMTGTIPQRSSTGQIIDNVWVSFDNELFYVLDGHTWTLANPGAPYCDTMTPVGKLLRTQPLTPRQMAATLQRQLRNIKRFVGGKRRHA